MDLTEMHRKIGFRIETNRKKSEIRFEIILIFIRLLSLDHTLTDSSNGCLTDKFYSIRSCPFLSVRRPSISVACPFSVRFIRRRLFCPVEIFEMFKILNGS